MGIFTNLFKKQPKSKRDGPTTGPDSTAEKTSTTAKQNYLERQEILNSLTTENVENRRAWLQEQERQKAEIRRPLVTAERLTNDGYCAESQDLLLPLLENIPAEHSYMRGVITERIAANYHQMRQYRNEVALLQDFIDNQKDNSQYRQYQRKFLRAIERAEHMEKTGKINDHL
ncbi:hypothetical protein ACFQHW_08200 [Lapidilactobacillus achengensis]|uniref:Uncharacterized protein n=1 Tax=Lapidilactobacillus achengensis TaxID=2486000 RepID=A0ABW1UR49_9LACO|nr:hypothetical protein [Lapidilactobacillus achengensis]